MCVTFTRQLLAAPKISSKSFQTMELVDLLLWFARTTFILSPVNNLELRLFVQLAAAALGGFTLNERKLGQAQKLIWPLRFQRSWEVREIVHGSVERWKRCFGCIQWPYSLRRDFESASRVNEIAFRFRDGFCSGWNFKITTWNESWRHAGLRSW